MRLKSLSNTLYRLATGRITLLALVIFFAFSATVLPNQAARAETYSGAAGSPDGSFFYTPADLYAQAEAYGPDGRAAYVRARWTFDVIWPLVYTFFLATSISWIFARAFAAGSRARLANLAPVAGMTLDFLENSATSLVMARYPATTPIIDWLAAIFTPLKWLFVNGSFVVLLVGLAAAAWSLIKKR